MKNEADVDLSVNEEHRPLGGASKRDLNSILKKLEKNYGDMVQVGKIIRTVDTVSTGSLLVDLATRWGGYPRGKVSIISGWEGAGKSTNALRAVANLQERGGTAAYIDTEYSFNPTWAEAIGVNLSPEMFTLIQPSDLETAGEVAVDLATSGAVDMIVFDSVAGAPIKAVVEGDLGDSNMGKRAKIISDFAIKLSGPISRNSMWMLFTNQLRDSLDPYKPKPVRPGGHALNFMSSLTIDLRKLKAQKDGSTLIRATIEKTRGGAPGKQVEYTVNEDGSIDRVFELTSILVDDAYSQVLDVQRAGAWYTLPTALFPEGENRFMGREKIQEALADLDAYEQTLAYVTERLIG